jgi:hypothetical protein
MFIKCENNKFYKVKLFANFIKQLTIKTFLLFNNYILKYDKIGDKLILLQKKSKKNLS